jgi:hypothetical protein
MLRSIFGREYSFGRMLRSIYGREYIWDVKKYFKAAVSNRNWAVAGAHLASADTGPEAGAHSPAPKLGSKQQFQTETGPWLEPISQAPTLGRRPEPTRLRRNWAGGRSPARLRLQAFCTVHQDGRLGAIAGRTKTDGSLPGPQTLAIQLMTPTPAAPRASRPAGTR